MNRETIIAVVLGILLGVGIGFFVLFQSSKVNKTKVIPVNTENQNQKAVNTGHTEDAAVLKVSGPTDGDVLDTNKVTIKGTAEKGSLLIIQSAASNKVLKTDKDTFETTFPIALGENIISINAYSKSSTPQQINLKVYYVKE